MSSGPFQRALAPGVVITNNKNRNEDKHFNQRELRERKIVTHEDYRPGQKKDRLDVKYQEEHCHDVVPYGEPIVRFCRRVDAAFVGTHLRFLIFYWS